VRLPARECSGRDNERWSPEDPQHGPPMGHRAKSRASQKPAAATASDLCDAADADADASDNPSKGPIRSPTI